MHESLFAFPSTLARYRSAPLLAERERFLHHCAGQGYTRGGLAKIAWLLRVVAQSPIAKQLVVRRADLDRMGRAFCASTRPVLAHAAIEWFAFMGQPQLQAPPEGRFASELAAFETFMREERGLSPLTILTRREQLRPFLDTLEHNRHVRSLQQITPQCVDRYLVEQSENGWSRRSLFTLAGTLRSFFHYAEMQRWCPSGLAAATDAPTIYALESLPRGPEWDQVKALIRSIQGNDPVTIRDRAVIMLLAVYGLRRGEVAALRLEDLDFAKELIRVTRPKSRRTQQYPLARSVGNALLHYLQHARPRCGCRAVFLAIKAPRRALSAASISAIVRWRLRAIGARGIPCGAHGCKHAANHVIDDGRVRG